MVSHPAARVFLGFAVLAACGIPLVGLTADWSSVGLAESPVLLRVMAPIFLAFAFFKGALGLDALAGLRQRDDSAVQRIHSHGSPAEVRRWAWYKLSAMLVAGAAGIGCAWAGWA